VIDVAEMAVSDRIDLGGPAEVTELRRGERLFHSAGITYGRQFSCHSCHPDGHTNGLSFDIEADGVGLNPVDNRTLRGILDTAPFKWEGTNPSLSRQCGPRLAVFFTRLAPYSPDELQALVRYMCTIERPPNPHRAPDGLTPVQYRGRLVFRRTTDNGGRRIPPEKRCVTCHDGAYFTNRAKVRVFTTMWYDDPVGDEVDDLFDDDSFAALGIAYYYSADVRRALDVPHLNNIHDGAPYLHNGGAETLHELWARFNTFDWHGQTNDLTRRQLNDLIAYLEAL